MIYGRSLRKGPYPLKLKSIESREIPAWTGKICDAILNLRLRVTRKTFLTRPPNRLVHLLSQELVSLDKVEMLVVDEADKLFEAGERGFREQLGAIYTACSGGQVVKAMFSATLGPEVETWARLNLDNMVKVHTQAQLQNKLKQIHSKGANWSSQLCHRDC